MKIININEKIKRLTRINYKKLVKRKNKTLITTFKTTDVGEKIFTLQQNQKKRKSWKIFY